MSTPADGPGWLLRQFATGLVAGLAGKSEASPRAPAPGETELTTLRSAWLCHRCPVCGHSFRVGDRVRHVAQGCTVHAIPGLCPTAAEAAVEPEAGGDILRDAFLAGLERACPLPTNVPVHRLVRGHNLLAPPAPGLPRHYCRVCGHTFRPGEIVIICPCHPDAPKCRVGVHRDHIRNLWCWDEWRQANPDISKRPCLAMS